MLANFLNSDELRKVCTPSLSYRSSPAYIQGLQKRVQLNFPAYALRLPDPAWIYEQVQRWPKPLRLGIRGLSWLILLKYWMILYDWIVLTRLLKRTQPDIVHINNGGYPGAVSCLAAALAARTAKVRYVVMVINNLAVPYTGLRRWLDYPIDRLVAHCVDVFVTGSQAASDRLGNVLHIPKMRRYPFHNGIALRQVTESIAQTRSRLGVGGFDGVLLGVVALMERRKGHRVLLKAVTKLIGRSPSVASKLKIVLEGDGPERSRLEELAREYGLNAVVSFVGVECNVVNFMQALDVLVLPSIDNEDFPNVILEAMALGKPVIASRIAGTPEQIEDGVSGILVPPGDAEALSRAMESVVGSLQLSRQFGDNGRRRFENCFSAEVAVRRYLQLYRGMIKEERT